jgi:ElaB/YqjD/DUF883 family membrane-anchored ribosome-binding protein
MENELLATIDKKIQEAENALKTMQHKYEMEQHIDKMKKLLKELRDEGGEINESLRERAADLLKKVATMIGG